MRFEVDSEALSLYPAMTIGVICGRVDGINPQFSQFLEEQRERAIQSLEGLDSSKLTQIAEFASWREAYRLFGAKAKKHKPTHEALIRRLLKDGTWPQIHPTVDLYLTNQTIHRLPHGGYDADRVEGTLRLTRSPGDEAFQPLGGGEETIEPGEVVYRDDRSVLTRRWNYRDCERTQMREDSKRFVLMIEAPSAAVATESVQRAAEDLAARYGEAFSGAFNSQTLSPREGAASFELIWP
ncbi:MAG: phenylalanine--tRNA ligase beta subunit-related protein [Acidobacteriota bacterium]